MNQMKSTRLIPSLDYYTPPHFPDNVWLVILGYLAKDNVQNLLDLARNLAEHPIGRIAQDYRYVIQSFLYFKSPLFYRSLIATIM